MPDSVIFSRRLWLLLAVFAIAWFSTLEYRKLIKPDEGRYAEIAREMAASGDWVTPRLNGLKYFEKPPLQYWATAAAFSAFGEREWTARLWPAITGFAAVVLAFLLGRRVFGSAAGLYAAAILASSLLHLFIGHLNTLDMGLSFFLQLALAGFVMTQLSPADARRGRNWMLLTWAALALAVLSKGLVALVLPGATLVVYSLANRDFSPWRRLHLLPGLAVFFAIAAPWFVAVSVANPEFAHFFFIHEHLERFLESGHRRTQAWWYFFPILALGLLPWLTAIPQGLIAGWRRSADQPFAPRRFLLLWSVVVFAFFSVSSSKLPSYILPIFPALAWLTGAALTECRPRSIAHHALVATLLASLALIAAPFVAGLGDAETTPTMMSHYGSWLAAGAALWLVASALALWQARLGRASAAILLMAGGGFVAGNATLLGHETLSASNSAYSLARQVRPLLSPGVAFYSVGMYEQTLTYYLQRTVTLVNYSDEMGFGLTQEPDKGIASVSEFASRWRADADAFAVMDPGTHVELQDQGLPMHIVARDTRRIIVRKP